MKGSNIRVIDLFCGIGGLTHGFELEGFSVVAGIDNDETCSYGYEKNNHAKFLCEDINDVTANDISQLFGNAKIKILVGCAPCQPYSALNLSKNKQAAMFPLKKFAQLIQQIKPEIVSMENVRGLVKYPVFAEFLKVLKKNSYTFSYEIVDASDYGIPQKRHRLVLLASLLGDIKLLPPTHLKKKVTVRDVIGDLPAIEDGETYPGDRYHKTSKLSALNKKRICATPPDGGDSASWDDSLILACHKKQTGKSYKETVYGRMRWDEPAPTMTTSCIGLGNGRFGHPEQHRAISLREAALFQTFPRNYEFSDPTKPVSTGLVSKFIGNAVPIALAQAIAKSIKMHLENQHIEISSNVSFLRKLQNHLSQTIKYQWT